MVHGYGAVRREAMIAWGLVLMAIGMIIAIGRRCEPITRSSDNMPCIPIRAGECGDWIEP